MKAFLAHVGHPGNIDIDFTVTRRRSVAEILEKLPENASERSFFSSPSLRSTFPSGWFNCWGVPRGAADEFNRMEVGDLVLIAPTIGVHDGGIHQLGVVKAICPTECFQASRVLWPQTPNDKLFPWVFLFDSEAGRRPWFTFLQDIGYREAYNPRGLFKSIAESRFDRWDGVEGYLNFLRREGKFRKVFPDEPSTQGGRSSGNVEESGIMDEHEVNVRLPFYSEPPPLRTDEGGVVRVGSSRISLDLIVEQYENGMTPENIVRAYDTLMLADVHAAIAHYLRHRAEVRAYLKRRAEEAEALRANIESERPGISRAELLARQAGEKADASAGQ